MNYNATFFKESKVWLFILYNTVRLCNSMWEFYIGYGGSTIFKSYWLRKNSKSNYNFLKNLF